MVHGMTRPIEECLINSWFKWMDGASAINFMQIIKSISISWYKLQENFIFSY